jgi:hypothetical protein
MNCAALNEPVASGESREASRPGCKSRRGQSATRPLPPVIGERFGTEKDGSHESA